MTFIARIIADVNLACKSNEKLIMNSEQLRNQLYVADYFINPYTDRIEIIR